MTPPSSDPVKKMHDNNTEDILFKTETDPKPVLPKIRVPPLYPDKPALWFAMMEAQFFLANVQSDEMKFNYVVNHIDPEHARLIDNIICSPPAENKYEAIKFFLIKEITKLYEEKLQQRLRQEEMGDKEPLEFLDHLLALAGGAISKDSVIDIWLTLLPSQARTTMYLTYRATQEMQMCAADVVHSFLKKEVKKLKSKKSLKECKLKSA